MMDILVPLLGLYKKYQVALCGCATTMSLIIVNYASAQNKRRDNLMT